VGLYSPLAALMIVGGRYLLAIVRFLSCQCFASWHSLPLVPSAFTVHDAALIAAVAIVVTAGRHACRAAVSEPSLLRRHLSRPRLVNTTVIALPVRGAVIGAFAVTARSSLLDSRRRLLVLCRPGFAVVLIACS